MERKTRTRGDMKENKGPKEIRKKGKKKERPEKKKT